MNSGKYEIKEGQLVNILTGGPIPADEPVFILRAQDLRSAETIYSYRDLCLTAEHILAIDEQIEKFEDWQERNPDKVKEPD